MSTGDLLVIPSAETHVTTPLDRVTCARIPTPALTALAGLRGLAGVSVLPGEEWSWVWWEAGDDRVLRAVLPAPGVELFEFRDDAWYRPGHRLPSFGLPPVSDGVALDRAVTPAPFSADRDPGPPPCPVALRLVRDARPRATTAALCPLAELVRWADSATTAEIEAIRGAISGDLTLLIGPALPAWPGSERFWGRSVLVPLGHESRPSLPEAILREALGATEAEILRLVPVGDGVAIESIPTAAIRPLTRAGVRLAGGGRTP